MIRSDLEGFVKRELNTLEDDLNKKLQKSLDNPLAKEQLNSHMSINVETEIELLKRECR